MKKKLNLGSGPSGINGWINYDYGLLPLLSKTPRLRHLICSLGLLPKSYDVSWPEIQLVNIIDELPLDDESIDYVFCSQVLEHFERYEALNILKEVHRVLKPLGTLRLSVPDIKKIFNSSFSAREINILWWGFEKDFPPKGIIGRISRYFIREHQWHYDPQSLKDLLNEAGFRKVKIFSFRKGTTPDLDKLEMEIHRQHSLYLEAQK